MTMEGNSAGNSGTRTLSAVTLMHETDRHYVVDPQLDTFINLELSDDSTVNHLHAVLSQNRFCVCWLVDFAYPCYAACASAKASPG